MLWRWVLFECARTHHVFIRGRDVNPEVIWATNTYALGFHALVCVVKDLTVTKAGAFLSMDSMLYWMQVLSMCSMMFTGRLPSASLTMLAP
jgi:hypothetical protein